jgi:replicative DNA helicase
MQKIEKIILSNLLHNEDYCRKVLPFIKTEYFSDHFEKVIAEETLNFFNEFNKPASLEILAIQIGKRKDLRKEQLDSIENYINELDFKHTNEDWLAKETEKFCKQRAVYGAIIRSIEIIDGKDKQLTQDAIPSLLTDALSVSFDKSVGHDYLDDFASRFDFYRRIEDKIPFGLELFNKITKGGLSNKTLNVILASTGVGKSLFMCDYAAAALGQGKNVLYVTLEMAEERIAERIDANLLNMTMEELAEVDKEIYETRMNKLIKKTSGKLIIKEYPTSSAHAGHFRSLIEELKLKRNFIPHVIVVDYLNICASSRLKYGAGVNSYTIVKSIAEELRALAQEYNVPVLSATQTTRDGMNNTDIDLTNTSESIGLPQTVDLMFALISTEELENLNQILVKQLKNRYNDLNYYKRFVIGVDRARMKLFNVEASAQANISGAGQDDGPAFDKTSFGKRMKSAGEDRTLGGQAGHGGYDDFNF